MAARGSEISDPLGLYHALTTPGVPPDRMRRDIYRLSHVLGDAAYQILHGTRGEGADVLCAVVLRGGLLLYPGLSQSFVRADFCLLGMRRSAHGTVTCEYMTEPARSGYDVLVLVDCVAATGGTLLAAREQLARSHRIPEAMVTLICSSERATGVLLAEGMDVVGFSLAEELAAGDVVSPDLGEMDVGDLFSGVSAPLRGRIG